MENLCFVLSFQENKFLKHNSTSLIDLAARLNVNNKRLFITFILFKKLSIHFTAETDISNCKAAMSASRTLLELSYMLHMNPITI